MTIDLFAGMPVSDYQRALRWYEQLLGRPPAFLPNPSEAVWELAEHRYLYIVVRPEQAGGGVQTLFVSELPGCLDAIGARGLSPATDETYDNGVRKVTYRDPDGNEVGYGATVS